MNKEMNWKLLNKYNKYYKIKLIKFNVNIHQNIILNKELIMMINILILK